jgi:lipopolysaccharide transport system permease protein
MSAVPPEAAAAAPSTPLHGGGFDGVPSDGGAAGQGDPLDPGPVDPTTPWRDGSAPGWGYVLGRLVNSPRVIARHWDMVWTSVRRELEVRLTGTLLGWAWPLVSPVFMFAIYYFIFAELLKFKMPNLPEHLKAAMGVYMFTGIVVWSGLAEAVGRGTSTIVENGNLIKKLSFPTETLALNVTLVGLVNVCFGVLAFLIAAFLTPVWPAPSLSLLWVPLILLAQLLFTYGLVLFLGTLQVFLRDTAQVVTIVLTVWMFATPLFWAPSDQMVLGIEEYLPLIVVNPVYHMVNVWRQALMGGTDLLDFVYKTSVATSMWIFALWSIGVYCAGYVFFVFAQRRFSDEV